MIIKIILHTYLYYFSRLSHPVEDIASTMESRNRKAGLFPLPRESSSQGLPSEVQLLSIANQSF